MVLAPEMGSVHGEVLTVAERVIIAPAPGRFRPVTERDHQSAIVSSGPDGSVVDGTAVVVDDNVVVEQVIGFIDGAGHSTPVRSAFSGLLMGLLAHAGERVREGQPVAWLRLA